MTMDAVAIAVGDAYDRGGFVMDNLREDAAARAAEDYDFGRGAMVETMSGWEHVTPGDEWTRRVQLSYDDGVEGIVATLVVRFAQASSTIAEVYAIDAKGNIFGSAASAG